VGVRNTNLLQTVATWSTKAAALVGNLIRTARLPMVVSWRAGQPVWKDWNELTAVKDGLKASDVVYACNRVLADALSCVPFIVEEEQADGTWQRKMHHPLEELLEQPNPEWSRQEMMEAWSQHLHLGGNALWHVNIGVTGLLPLELWPIPMGMSRPIPLRDGTMLQYTYTVEDTMGRVAASQIIHAKFMDPENFYWGMSAIKAAAKLVDTDVAANNYNYASMDNRAMPDLVIAPDAENGRSLNPKQHADFRASIADSVQGADNSHGVIVPANKVQITKLNFTPVELDFLNSRKFNRECICAVHRVAPPLLLFDMSGGSLSNNIDPIFRFFWENTVLPIHSKLCGAINRRLIPYYEGRVVRKDGLPVIRARTPGTRPLRVAMDYSDVKAMQRNLADDVKTAVALIAVGVPPKLAFELVKCPIPPYTGWDVPRENAAPTDPLTPPTDPEAITAQKMAMFKALHRAGYSANVINARLELGLPELPFDGHPEDY
jgi:HK97 family phage portal protein